MGLLAENDSAKHAGISLETLREYTKFGFIKATERDGEKFYRDEDLDTVFRSVGQRQTLNSKIEVINENRKAASTSDLRSLSAKRLEPQRDDHAELVAENRRLREEVNELKQEREWLKERLEKLEARCERDQMLLLSESETVRRLATSDSKKSFWSFSLPWLRSDS